MKPFYLLFLVMTALASTEGNGRPQHPKRVYRLGWIALNGSAPPRDFMTEIRNLGYIEGQSIIIDYRSAEGSEERLSKIAIELVRHQPDVIYAGGNSATDAVMDATNTIPIVFSHGDPIWSGVAGSLAQPGKNLTGLNEMSFELAGKRLELLRDTFPKISRVAVLLVADASVHIRQFADMEKVARVLGVQLQALRYKSSLISLDAVFQQGIDRRANSFLVLQNPALFRHQTRILDFAARNRLPAIYPVGFADAGGLMTYGPSPRELNRRVAFYVDRILKGAKPSDLPVEQPKKFELIINLKTAKALGLTIPSRVLMWADKVIE